MTLSIETLQHEIAESPAARESEKILKRLTDEELLAGERRALIHHLLGETHEQHREAVALEIDHIAKIAEKRIIEREYGNGDRSIYFATRDTTGEKSRLDDIYELTQKADGSIRFQIDFMRSGDSGYRIVADEQDNFTCYALLQGYIKPIEAGSDSEQRFLEDYMDRSSATARIMNHRRETDPKAATAAHDEAKGMLRPYLDAYEA